MLTLAKGRLDLVLRCDLKQDGYRFLSQIWQVHNISYDTAKSSIIQRMQQPPFHIHFLPSNVETSEVMCHVSVQICLWFITFSTMSQCASSACHIEPLMSRPRPSHQPLCIALSYQWQSLFIWHTKETAVWYDWRGAGLQWSLLPCWCSWGFVSVPVCVSSWMHFLTRDISHSFPGPTSPGMFLIPAQE